MSTEFSTLTTQQLVQLLREWALEKHKTAQVARAAHDPDEKHIANTARLLDEAATRLDHLAGLEEE